MRLFIVLITTIMYMLTDLARATAEPIVGNFPSKIQLLFIEMDAIEAGIANSMTRKTPLPPDVFSWRALQQVTLINLRHDRLGRVIDPWGDPYRFSMRGNRVYFSSVHGKSVRIVRGKKGAG